ncbi:MAG: ATP-binding protein [Alphaproteobacteria bacterium]|nr:ATP-binding protein [Alphaproteobacteria bacterium]
MTLLDPSADPSCPRCGGVGTRVVQAGTVLEATTCTCVAPSCPVCDDTGYVQVGTGFRAPVRRCDHLELAHRRRLFTAARLPGRYAHATLDDPGEPTGHAATAVTHVQLWVRTLCQLSQRGRRQSNGVILFGGYGTGKTHLAVAAARALTLDGGLTVRFVEFSHLLTDLKATFERREGTADLLEPLSTCDVLVIDEIGRGRMTEFEGTVIDEIVTRRYNAGLPVLGTTNFGVGPATGRATANAADRGAPLPTLADRLDGRVFSRLQETCDFVSMDGGEDRRRRAPKARQAGRIERAR